MTKPTIDILSLFPDQVRAILESSILRRAQLKGRVQLTSTDLRQFAEGQYRAVDDTPFGGGQGMLFRAEVLEKAMQAQLSLVGGDRSKMKVIYMTPRGATLTQNIFNESAQWLTAQQDRHLVFVAGRYEGVDERFVDSWVDLELSAGDFVVSGGELPSLMAVDGIVRLLPGVLGDERSSVEESFAAGLLEHPQYTKPRDFQGQGVPPVLTEGHHQNIQDWKIKESLMLTAAYRPDLIRAHNGQGLAPWAQDLLEHLKKRVKKRVHTHFE